MDARKATNENHVVPADAGKSDQAAGPRLQSSIVKIRDAMAERQDAVEGLREREHVLLQALQEELKAFADDIPKDEEWIQLTLSQGERPRFWVDPTSHVAIDRDRRTYRFLRDTRLGRLVIRESEDVKLIAQCVADYTAERIVERERVIDGDWLAAVQTRQDADVARREEQRSAQAAKPARRRSKLGLYIAGCLTGMILVFGIWAYNDPAMLRSITFLIDSVREKVLDATISAPPASAPVSADPE